MNRILVLVNVTAALIGVSYGMHGPVLPIFAKNVVGATYGELGLLGLANFVPYMFVPLLIGLMLSRFNNGYLVAVGAAINVVSMYLHSVAQSTLELVAFRVMIGVAHAFIWPPSEAIISDHSTRRNRVRNISWFTMFFAVGYMAGPLVGTALLEDVDLTYRMLFQITAFVAAAALIMALASSKWIGRQEHRTAPAPDAPTGMADMPLGVRGGVLGNLKTGIHGNIRSDMRGGARRLPLASLGEIRRFPHVVVLLVYSTSSLGILLSIYPAFLNDRGMGDMNVLVLFFIFGIFRIVGLAVAGRMARATGASIMASVAALAAGFAISAVADGMFWFAVALALMGFALSALFPLTLEIILTKTKKGISGKMIGTYEAVFGIGWSIGPIMGGYVTESFDSTVLYMALFWTGVGITALTVAFRKRLEPAAAG